MVKQILTEAENKMKKSIAALKHHYSTVRSGKANVQCSMTSKSTTMAH